MKIELVNPLFDNFKQYDLIVYDDNNFIIYRVNIKFDLNSTEVDIKNWVNSYFTNLADQGLLNNINDNNQVIPIILTSLIINNPDGNL